MTDENSNGYYSEYDLNSGTHNNWRRSKDWPKAGKGDLSVWAVIPAMFIIAFIFADLTTDLLWDLFYLLLGLFLLCKFRNQNIYQLNRFFMQRFRVKNKRNTPFWLERTLFSIMLVLLINILDIKDNNLAYAKFEIVIPPKAQPVDHFKSSGEIYLQGGFGKDVKLYDLMNLLLPQPLSAEFATSELKDIKVSWYSDGRIFLNEVLANISRRYGVQFTWRNAAGILEVKWDTGICKKVIQEAREEQINYSNQVGASPAEPYRFIQRILSKEQQMEIIC